MDYKTRKLIERMEIRNRAWSLMLDPDNRHGTRCDHTVVVTKNRIGMYDHKCTKCGNTEIRTSK
jgi:hypothetical protein